MPNCIETWYLPAKIDNGVLMSGMLVSDGTLVDACADTNKRVVDTDSHSEVKHVDESVNTTVEVAEVNELKGSGDNVLVDEQSRPSVVAEAEGDLQGGSAEGEGDMGMLMDSMTQEEPRPMLVQAIEEDPSLATARALAKSQTEGYQVRDGIVFRTRLDKFGDARDQICLTKSYRTNCMKMAHDNFGHQGHNKMIDLIRPYFYWPTITKDCLSHIKSCSVCQRMDKSVPRKVRMRKESWLPSQQKGWPLIWWGHSQQLWVASNTF